MKKIFTSLGYLLLLSFILFELLLPFSKKENSYSVTESAKDEVTILLPEGYYEVPNDCYYENVVSGTISNEVNSIAAVKIEKCIFSIDSLNLVGGDIIPSGFEENGKIYSSRIRINKYENSLLLGDLIDTTIVEYNLTEYSFPIDIDSFEIKATFLEKPIKVIDYDVIYVDGSYLIKAYIENDGTIFSNQYISFKTRYNSYPINGIYVKKEAVQYDGDGPYLNQVVYYQKIKSYKKIKINIEGELGVYFKITSVFSIKDCLICY